jgi:hypothetical protein
MAANANIYGSQIKDIQHNIRSRLGPDWYPVSHVHGDCHCELNNEFVITPHEKQAANLNEQTEVLTRGNQFVKASLQAFPTRVLKPVGQLQIVNETTARIVSRNPGGYTTANSDEALWSGGFLSGYQDAAKNVFVARQEVDIAAVTFWWGTLGGPGNAWNKFYFLISEGGICKPCQKGCCVSVPGAGGFGDKGIHFTYSGYDSKYGGEQKLHVTANFITSAGGPMHLKKDHMYVFYCINDVGANTGYFGKLKGNPPWGEFIKSMYGYVLTGNECGGPPGSPYQCNNPDCGRAFAMTIYTKDELEGRTVKLKTGITGGGNIKIKG